MVSLEVRKGYEKTCEKKKKRFWKSKWLLKQYLLNVDFINVVFHAHSTPWSFVHWDQTWWLLFSLPTSFWIMRSCLAKNMINTDCTCIKEKRFLLRLSRIKEQNEAQHVFMVKYGLLRAIFYTVLVQAMLQIRGWVLSSMLGLSQSGILSGWV